LEYEQVRQNLMNYKGWISGASLRDDINKDKIVLLSSTTLVISEVVSYKLIMTAHTKLKTEKPVQDIYRKTYDDAKKNLELYKTINLPFADMIIQFVEEFEKNEKS